jgi:hypothetical protein
MNRENCKGHLTSLMSITTIIGPLIMNYLFKYFTTEQSSFSFPWYFFFIRGTIHAPECDYNLVMY